MIKTYTGNEGVRDTNTELVYGIAVRNGLVQQVVTVGVAATLIPASAQSRRLVVMIMNVGTVPVYIATMRIDIEDDAPIYGIASVNAEVRILEGY